MQGGSTITQQLAKNLLLTKETITCKLLEAGYAVKIEQNTAKTRSSNFTLMIFISVMGSTGSKAQPAFILPYIWELETDEQALLVGLIRGPELYHPTAIRSGLKRRI